MLGKGVTQDTVVGPSFVVARVILVKDLALKRVAIGAVGALACVSILLSGCGGSSGSATSSASSGSSFSSSSSSSSSTSIITNDPAAAKPGYDLVFDENFDSLDVSAWGPGTRWIAHTPWGGDFGQSKFADPVVGFPFTTNNGILRIEARKLADGTWQSGLLASVDTNGNGFAQQYGYFEMRAKLPDGEGVWPAFWLDTLIPSTSSDPSIEIDGMEYYGKYNDAINAAVTVWTKDRSQSTFAAKTLNVAAGSLTSDFHTYGISVEADWTIVYLDGVELWRTPTPTEHKHKLMILVDLAMGGADQSITGTVSPAYMYVDYVRAYRRTGT